MSDKTVFQSIDMYPELCAVQAEWQTIREEAIGSLESMTYIRDNRVRPQEWKVLPLMPEEEDRRIIPEEICRQSRRLAPRTIQLVESVPKLKAYAFSVLRPQGHIRPHRHTNPYVTASLCLQSGGESYIIVDGQRRDYRDGEIIIFDYTRTHEVVNRGNDDRIVLLISVDNRAGIAQVDFREHFPPVWGQRGLQSCMALVICDAIWWELRRRHGKAPFMPSPLFLYYNARKRAGHENHNIAVRPSDAMEAVREYGVCPEDVWPYSPRRYRDRPPAAAYEAAKRYAGVTFEKLEQREFDVRALSS